jgi:hypothetical protein
VQLSALVPIVIFGLVATGVGVRLLGLWWQTRQLPELAIGLGMVMLSFVAVPLTALGRAPDTAATPLGRYAFVVGIGATVIGLGLNSVFVWRVYRPKQGWAAALVVATFGGLMVCGVGMAHAELTGRALSDILIGSRPWSIGLMVLLGLTYLWGGVESMLYHSALRRRLAIGLVDPVLVNRFLLWSVANMTTVVLACGLVIAGRRGVMIARDPAGLSAIAVAGVVMSVTWWLTFFAPESYRRWVRDRAARSASASGSSGQA